MEEDQESKSLLVIESTSKSLKANPSIYIYLIGITIISAILAVAYSTSGIVNKSYSVFSELNAQAPEPSSTVSYNGKIYASLGGGDVNGLQNKCQSDRYLIPPNGWEVAPDDADSRGVTAAYPWDTHVNVMSNGCGYGSASYTKGVQWSCGMLGSNGAGGYKVNSCSLMVLIMKSVPPYKYAPNPSLMIQYKGYYYASLSGADPHSSTYTCQQEYLAVPKEDGWEVAPDEVDSRAANTMYQWNTAVNVFSNGYGYGTGAWNVGLWNYNMLSKVDKGGGVFEYKEDSTMFAYH